METLADVTCCPYIVERRMSAQSWTREKYVDNVRAVLQPWGSNIEYVRDNKLSALKQARKLSRSLTTCRDIFQACLGEYERWLHSSSRDFHELVNSEDGRERPQIVFPAQGTVPMLNRPTVVFPPTYTKPTASSNRFKRASRHEKFTQQQTSNQKKIPSIIPKADYIVYTHAVAPVDHAKYPAQYNPEKRVWEQLVFPADQPFGKRDSELLKQWYVQEQQKQAKAIELRGETDSLDADIARILPVGKVVIHELARQFPKGEEHVGEFLVELWEGLIRMMFILMKSTQEMHAEHVARCQTLKADIDEIMNAKKDKEMELKVAQACTANLQEDTSILERAILAKEKSYEKTIQAHQSIAERVGKVIRLVQEMEDAESLEAYKEGKRTRRVRGVPEMMDRLSDILLEHTQFVNNTRANPTDEKGESTRIGESSSSDSGEVSSDEEESQVGANQKEEEAAKRKNAARGTVTTAAAVGPDVLCLVERLGAEISFLKLELVEKFRPSSMKTHDTRGTQTDSLDRMELTEADGGEMTCTVKEGIKYPRIIINAGLTTTLPPAFVPQLFPVHVVLLLVSRVYDHFSQFMRGSAASTKEATALENGTLVDFIFNLFLDTEEIPSLAQKKLANFAMSAIQHSVSNIECYVFVRLANLDDQATRLPLETVHLLLSARLFLTRNIKTILGKDYCPVHAAKDLINILQPAGGAGKNLATVVKLSRAVTSTKDPSEVNVDATLDLEGSTPTCMPESRVVFVGDLLQMTLHILENDRTKLKKRVKQSFLNRTNGASTTLQFSFETFVDAVHELQPTRPSIDVLESMYSEICAHSRDEHGEHSVFRVNDFVGVCINHGVVQAKIYNFGNTLRVKEALEATDATNETEMIEKNILDRLQLSWKEHETAIKQLVSLNNVEMKDKITHLENLLEVKVDSKVATALYEEILKNVGK